MRYGDREEIELLENERDELLLEVERHHELIVKLRDGLLWALDELVPVRRSSQYMELAYGVDFTWRYDELRTMLAREVG